ncbi:hypothetical protein ACFP3O_33595 [Paraburkholderia silvatlantica]|uniref:hypothetical protein n=1 Tax=Paraburkholderia silvatlantica TaxID=321895 RepID=UPI0035A03FE1
MASDSTFPKKVKLSARSIGFLRFRPLVQSSRRPSNCKFCRSTRTLPASRARR